MTAAADRPPAGGALALAVPRQHGAWSVLLISLALGTAAVGAFNAPALVLLAAALGGFVGRHAAGRAVRMPAVDGRRMRLLAFGIAAAAAAVGLAALLVLARGLWLLIPLGSVAVALAGIALVLEAKKKDRSAGGELLGIVGLSLTLPAIAYASTGRLEARAMGLWTLAVLFFMGSVFHVRYLLRRRDANRGELGDRLRAGGMSLACHAGALAAAIGMAAGGLVPPAAAPALAPVLVKSGLSVFRRAPVSLTVRRVGYGELAHALVFAAWITLAYRGVFGGGMP